MTRVLLTNARLIDGTGAPARQGELLLEDDRIAEVGEVRLRPDRVLDVGHLAVAPGFIDMHTHSDFTLLFEPEATAKLSQGVTTEVVGNCGLGPAPANAPVREMYQTMAPLLFGGHQEPDHTFVTLEAWRERVTALGPGVNAVPLVPHGNIRCAVMGMAEGDATAAQVMAMRELVTESMEQGAFGISTGLVYPPGAFAQTDELCEVVAAIKPFCGLYATHVRDETSGVVDAVAEALTIGRRAGVAVQLSHHKAAGQPNWGKTVDTLALCDKARSNGERVHCDVYPYSAGTTILAALCLPMWAFEGGPDAVLVRLRNRSERERIIAEFKKRLFAMLPLSGFLSLIPERILLPLIMWQMGKLVRLCSVPRQRHFEGLSLWQMARARRQEIFEAMLDLLAEEELAVACTVLVMHEADIRRVLQHPNTLIGSDSFPMRGGNPHPRTFGTFARVLGHYVREVSLLGLEQAVHRMTGLAAFVLGLTDRGRLVPGAVADLVVFDPERISDEATLDAPTRPATGIRHVFVAGRQALADGRLTGVRAGRVLRRGEALALK